MTILESAAAYLAARLATEAKYTQKLAADLIQRGDLVWNGAGFVLNESAYLLGVAPGLLSHQTLQKLVADERSWSPLSTNGAAARELERRMAADLPLELTTHLQWSESSDELSPGEISLVEAFSDPTHAEHANVLERLARIEGPAARCAAATRDNVRNIQRNQLTDLQRELEGLPPLDAA